MASLTHNPRAACKACTNWVCRLEEAASPYDRAGRVQRPVIRLDDLTVFVRIEPHRRDTSMLFMLRPGWRSFWEALGGRPSSTPAGAAQGWVAPALILPASSGCMELCSPVGQLWGWIACLQQLCVYRVAR